MTAVLEPRLSRKDRQQLKRESYWQHRFEQADTPADRTSVAWDHARARIKKLPPGEQDAEYERALYALDSIARKDNRS